MNKARERMVISDASDLDLDLESGLTDPTANSLSSSESEPDLPAMLTSVKSGSETSGSKVRVSCFNSPYHCI